MKTKFLLPMIAMIFAIGMSFASTDVELETGIQSDYIRLENNSWLAIPEQPCQGTDKNCQVRAGEGGPLYDVYDEMSFSTLKEAPADHQPAVINF